MAIGKINYPVAEINSLLGAIKQAPNIYATQSAVTQQITEATEGLASTTQVEEAIDEAIGNLTGKADIDGNYPQMSVGFAEHLIGSGEVSDEYWSEKSTPFNGALRITSLVGSSVVWNQHIGINTTDRSYNEKGVHITDHRDGSYTIWTDEGGATSTVSRYIFQTPAAPLLGHKLFIDGIEGASSYGFGLMDNFSNIFGNIFSENKIVQAKNSGTTCSFSVYVAQGVKIATPVTWRPRCVDLTKMFGAGNEPTTVSEAIERMPKGVAEYEYNDGEMVNFSASAIKSTDGANSFTRTLPSIILRAAGSIADELIFDSATQQWNFFCRVGVRAFQEGDDSDNTLITDGTNTNYQLSSSTVRVVEDVNMDIPIFRDGSLSLTTTTPTSALKGTSIFTPKITNTNPLYGRVLAVDGDSICAGASTGGGYAAMIGADNGMTVQNNAVGGGTIVSGDNTRHRICDEVGNLRTDADYIILEGGVNDAGLDIPLGSITSDYAANLDTTTFYGAFEYMLKELVTRFAGKKYGYLAVHQMVNGFRITDDESTSYYWAARKCCEKWGVPFCDLNDKVPPFGFIQSLADIYTLNGDGWHLTEEGYRKYYVDKIVAWMKTL